MALVMLLIVAAAGCATRRYPAPVVDRHKPDRHKVDRHKVERYKVERQKAPQESADFHIVRGGDTLYSIALDHGADYRELAQWNGLDDPTKIQVGQRLRVTPPPGQAQVGPARIAGRVDARALEAKSAPPQPVVAPQPAPTGFAWPAKGRVLAEFAEPRKKGIDIDGRPGDPVVAAAAGRVTYVGTGIQGMGKLVVIKHDNGFITVYAHNKDIVVKEQQAVARGQKIAEIGSTDAERPKLHFQIRKGAAPVDPMLYLPKT
jgi:lipoprotein NlpD